MNEAYKKQYESYETRRAKAIVKLVALVALGIVALIVLFGCFYIVDAGERGIVLTFGNPDMNPKSEGLHFKIPIVQSIVKMDIKTQKYEADASAASKDLQTVTSKIATNYRLEPSSVPTLYKEVGIDYQSRIIMPLEQEVVKATTAKFTAEELITRREDVRLEIKQVLHDRLAPRGIIVEEVSITNFDFSPTFNAVIEMKVTNEQAALAAKNKLEQIKYEAEQTVAKAIAEAEALRLKKQSITPELVQLSQIEVQSKALDVQAKAIEKWNGVLPTTLFSGEGSILPTFQVQQQMQTT